MVDTKAKIIANEKIAPDFFKITFESPEISKIAKPGQFVMVRCSNTTNPLLRRPFSFHRIKNRYFELLYKIVGRGTEILSRRKKGELLNILGPLGNGFNIPPTVSPPLSALLIGGGTGIAPLLALAERLKAYNLKLITLLGARTRKHILCENDFKRLDAKVLISTEDGSRGYKGLATDLLHKKLSTVNRQLLTIYACGPRPMFKEIARLIKPKRIPCELSLEENMACGTGACLGCAIKTKYGYKMVCKDGPIFNAEEIVW